MSNMAGIVDAKSNRQDNVDAGDDVDGDPPEVEEADDVSEGEDDGQDDQDADPMVHMGYKYCRSKVDKRS